MTALACRFTRSGWSAAALCGRRRRDGIVAISAAQLAYMLDGIDWRNPIRICGRKWLGKAASF
jgi:hypothetical protein